MYEICAGCKAEICGGVITKKDGQVFHHDCDPDRIAWIEENQPKWKENGMRLRSWRELLSIGITDAAKAIGVSTSTLSRFENGEPVMRAKLLSNAYEYYLEIKELQVVNDMSRRRSEIERFREKRKRNQM